MTVTIYAKREDITWKRGALWRREFDISVPGEDEIGPLDLGSGVLTCEVREGEALDSDILLNITVDVIDDVGGILQTYVSAAQTDALAAGVLGRWFLYFTPDDDSDPRIIRYGTVTVKEAANPP